MIRPDFFSGFNFTTAQVVCITAMINHKFITLIQYRHLKMTIWVAVKYKISWSVEVVISEEKKNNITCLIGYSVWL